jgi:hypothetical protein
MAAASTGKRSLCLQAPPIKKRFLSLLFFLDTCSVSDDFSGSAALKVGRRPGDFALNVLYSGMSIAVTLRV